MELRMRVRRLEDGRFVVGYWWHWRERTHREYFDTAEELGVFLAELAKNTKWRK